MHACMLDRGWENGNTHSVLMRSQFKQTARVIEGQRTDALKLTRRHTHTHSLQTHYIPWTEAMFTSCLGYYEVKLVCAEISSRQTGKERKIKRLTSTNRKFATCNGESRRC